MLEEILEDREFGSMMRRNIYDLLNFLIKKGTTFDILANTKFVSFNPELPDEIKSSFNPSVILFSLAGYSLSSVEIIKEDGGNKSLSKINNPIKIIMKQFFICWLFNKINVSY